jgi:hypothetical protein
MAKAVKGSPVLQTLDKKVDLFQLEASSSGKPTQEAGSSSQLGIADKSKGGQGITSSEKPIHQGHIPGSQQF